MVISMLTPRYLSSTALSIGVLLTLKSEKFVFMRDNFYWLPISMNLVFLTFKVSLLAESHNDI